MEAIRGLYAVVLTAAMVLVVSGCTDGATSGVAPESSVGSAVVGVPPQDDDWDLDQAGLLRLYEGWLDGFAAQSMVDDPPEVDLVRFVTTAEWPQAQASCLSGSGFSFAVSGGGIEVVGEVPPQQANALNLAVYRCGAMYPADPRTQIPLPRVRAELQYHYWADTVAPCVRAQGIDPGDAPSLEVWVDEYYVNPPAWDPFDAAAGSEEQLDLLYDACPRDAPDLYPPVPG